MTPTETSSPVIGATCTKASLQTVTPDGAQINAFKCGSTGDGQVAAVEYGPGVNVVFAQTTGIGGPWEIINKNKVCGTASAGLPPAVLAFCSKA